MFKNCRFLIGAAALVAAIMVGNNAARAENFYAYLNGGYSLGSKFTLTGSGTTTTMTELSNDPVFGGGIGYQVNDYLAGQIGFAYRSHDKNDSASGSDGKGGTASITLKQTFSSLSFMPEIIGQYPINNFAPYAKLGLGLSMNKYAVDFAASSSLGAGTISTSLKSTSFAWAIGVGAKYNFDPIFVDAGYQFFKPGSVDDTVDTGAHSVITPSGYNEFIVAVGYNF